ncbi:NYN domain-containing protein [Heliobacterium mobile]|uniref:NYN domain-containing protein n=1 Tax=Heliobacterium mobile TaxID=28064 RepID=UPI0014797CCD|nr:NYN domain-containing protein [Heliobacterium mobile]
MKPNVAIYVDCDNLYRRLEEYGLDPISDLNFFQKISEMFKENYNIIKYTAFANFDNTKMGLTVHNVIYNYGVYVKHCSIDGKGSTDMEIVIEAITDLFRNPNIDYFVIISNDRDYIPLFRVIKAENKRSYVISTKNGFNEVVNVFADHHQYLEDLFEIELLRELNNGEDTVQIDENLMEKYKKIASLFYDSRMYKSYKENGNTVGLNGYLQAIRKTWKDKNDTYQLIRKYLYAASKLEYILIKKDENGNEYIYEGRKMSEFVSEDTA